MLLVVGADDSFALFQLNFMGFAFEFAVCHEYLPRSIQNLDPLHEGLITTVQQDLSNAVGWDLKFLDG